MNIGIFSDIHSDLVALQKTLAYLKEQSPDQLLCLGDVVEAGRGSGDAVVERLQAEPIPCVQGNHDQYTIQNHAWLLRNSDLTRPDTQARMLKASTIEYLQLLPQSLRYTWEGRRVLVHHGTLWSLSPSSPTRFFKYFAEQSEADVILLGHTHIPMHIQYGNVHFYNPGAVSAVMGGVTCGILSLPECTFQVWDVLHQRSADVPLIQIQPEAV